MKIYKTPLEFALSFYGEKEYPGKKNNNPLIVAWTKELITWVRDDETPWCSTFMNYVCSRTGFEFTGKANARSWLEKGQEIKIETAQPGFDIVVFWRESRNSWKGHVGLYIRHNDDYVWVLGGNQRNEVNISAYPRNRVLSVKRLNEFTT